MLSCLWNVCGKGVGKLLGKVAGLYTFPQAGHFVGVFYAKLCTGFAHKIYAVFHAGEVFSNLKRGLMHTMNRPNSNYYLIK